MITVGGVASAYVLGTLAATPFVWAFIFKTAFTLSVFCVWNSEIFFYAPLYMQSVILTVSTLKFGRYCDRIVHVATPTAAVFTLCTAYSLNFVERPFLIVGFFLVTLFILSAIFPILYTTVYLCGEIYQSYFALGGMTAMMIYYTILFFNIFGKSGTLIPFMAMLGFGMYAFQVLKKNAAFAEGLFARRAIYILDSERYMKYSLWTMCREIWRELATMIALTVAMVVLCICFFVYTDVMAALGNYTFLFCVGVFFCGEVSAASYICTLIFACLLFISSGVLFWVENMDVCLATALLIFTYMAYCCAITSCLKIIRITLKRGINVPAFNVILCCLCNLCLTVVFLAFNKCSIRI